MEMISGYLYEATGINKISPRDQFNLIFYCVACLPIGYVFKYISSPFMKQLIGMVLGLYFQWFLYGNDMLLVTMQSVVVYLLCIILKKKCVLPVFIECFIFLSYFHIKRMYESFYGWNLDASTIVMMNTLKWTSFACNYYDGLTEKENIYQLKKLPNIFEYFSWVTFYASAVIGPFYEFTIYNNFINSDLKKVNTIKQSLTTFLRAIGFIIVLQLHKFFVPTLYQITEEFYEKSFLYKVVFTHISIITSRAKYYTGWYLNEAGVDMCGLSYNKENNSYDLVRNAYFSNVELANDLTMITNNWNISTAIWLKRYVNSRVKNSAIALATVCIWHGYYPGYYISYFQFFFVLSTKRTMYKLRNTSTILINLYNFSPKLNWTLKFLILHYILGNGGQYMTLLGLDRAYYYTVNTWEVQLPIFIGFLIFMHICKMKQFQTVKKD